MQKKTGTEALMGDIAFAMTEYGPDFMHFLAKPLTGMRVSADYLKRGDIKGISKKGWGAPLKDKASLKRYELIFEQIEQLSNIYQTWTQAVIRVSDGKYPHNISEIPRERLLEIKREIGRLTIDCLKGMKPVLKKISYLAGKSDEIYRRRRAKRSVTFRNLNLFASMLGEIVSSFETMQRSFGKTQRHVDVNSVVKETLAATAFFRQRRRMTTGQRMQIDVKTRLARNLPKPAVDPVTLMNAVTNVLSNAQRATGDQGTIRIETLARRRNVFVRMTDHGPGIPPKLRRKIMQLGVGTHSGRFPEVEGWHTGLALSRAMLTAQGGNVRVARTSTRGSNRGTTIEIRLPIKPTIARKRIA